MGHADPTSQARARSSSRGSFIKRRSFFGGGGTARPESMSFDPIPAPPQQPFKVSAAAPVQSHILYHDLVPSQRTEETSAVQHKRRSIFSAFKLGSRRQEQEPVFEYQQPRREIDPLYPEQLPRSHHARGPPLPVQADIRQRDYRGDNDRVSSRPHSVVLPATYTNKDSGSREHKKSTISPPFNFQHVTHTHKRHLPALETVEEKDLTREFWAASAYQLPQQQLQGIQADDLSQKRYTMGILRGAASSQQAPPARSQSRPPPPESLTRVRSNSREDITALPGFQPAKKEGAIKRRDEVDALLGMGEAKQQPRKTEGLKRTESTKPKNDSSPSLLGFDFGLRPTRSHSTSSRRTEVSSAEDSSAAMLGFGWTQAKRSAESSRSKEQHPRDGKKSLESNRPAESHHRTALASLLGNKERSQSDSSTSTQKRNDVNVLLGLTPKDAKRHSKHADKANRQDEMNALLGLRPMQDRARSKSRQPPPAPLRPRRSDEALKAVRYESTSPAPSPALTTTPTHGQSPHLAGAQFAPPPIPERPRRADHDEQFLRDMGFAQLLHRPNSNEARQTANTPASVGNTGARYSEDFRRVSIDAESVYPSDVPELDPAAEAAYHMQQANLRAKQPLPSLPPLPEQYSAAWDARTPLQTVVEHTELVSPLQSPADSAMSPVSPNSTHSARMLSPRSPELTGPGMPDDETWMDEIDFLYKQNAEATNDFDWDNVSMTTHRLSERHSLNIASLTVPRDPALAKKLSEGSLRQSYHLPSSRTSKDLQYIHRDFHNPRKYYPPDNRHELDVMAGARASPEVRVISAEEQNHDSRHDVGALQMHGYESLAAGYLSDPESVSSQHRKSNSYGSWESRRSGLVQNQQPGRSSNTSLNSVPELMHARRGPKQQSTTYPQPTQQPMSPYQEPHVQHPMNEYAAFTVGPYAGGVDSRPQSAHKNAFDHTQHPFMPQAQSLQVQTPQPHHHHQQQQFHHYYHPSQEHTAAADYLSLRRPETIDENAILRAAGEAVRHGRAESHAGNRYLHQQPEGRAGWI